MWELFLGHLVGDYLFQTDYMAHNKSKNSLKGYIACFIHCILYTLAVCLFMWNFDLIWIVAVFLSHFFIDKYSLGEVYMHYIKGSGLKDYLTKYDIYATPTVGLNDALEGGFKAYAYALTDNTMHLVLMWIAYKLIY